MNTGCHSQTSCTFAPSSSLNCQKWHPMVTLLNLLTTNFGNFTCSGEDVNCTDCPNWSVAGNSSWALPLPYLEAPQKWGWTDRKLSLASRPLPCDFLCFLFTVFSFLVYKSGFCLDILFCFLFCFFCIAAAAVIFLIWGSLG
jgi:hypothetical protein